MPYALPVFIVSLFCSWFKCEMGPEPPYLHLSAENERKLFSSITGYSEQELEGRSDEVRGPLVYTKQGPVEGYMSKTSEGRDVHMFTGIPYGEPPTGPLRFRDPVPRKPWRGILKATSDSPYCIQASGATMGMIRGQEDCLYLEVHTPRLPKEGEEKVGAGLPVIIWIPAGTNMYGRSSSYGSTYLLNEDVILVPINIRYGVLGYLASGDEASPGNWGLKDQALAVKWVYDNIEAFGGDPNRIIIGGMSSGGYAAHSMLFTKHETKNYIKGIIGLSASSLSNHGLDAKGRVQESSNIVAKQAGCPTAAEGKSWEMVECLRRQDPYMLTAHQFIVFRYMPHMSQMWGPTIEPDVPNAFISELPETLYEKGEVPKIPLILTRTEDETGFFQQRSRFTMLPIYHLNWYKWMPLFFKLAYRTTKLGEVVSPEEADGSLRKLNKFYFGKDAPPRALNRKDFLNFVKMGNDGMYNVPCWKALELHNKIAPTYSYIQRQRTYSLNLGVRLLEQLSQDYYGAAHASDFFVVFNNSQSVPPLKPDSDIGQASKNLNNLIANFAAYGKPLYRTPEGDLLPLWTTIGDINSMNVLNDFNNISMAIDPLPSTMRRKIWEQVKF